METKTKFILIFIVILLIPLTSYGQQIGTLEINLKSVGDEMADYHGTALKIYQGNQNIPFKTIDSLTGNPYKVSLPIGYEYKVEVYANSMYANVGYVNLQDSNEKLDLVIPNTIGILFTVVYDDGATPIDNATVSVKSNNGYEYWTTSTTDKEGNTIRFWLQPTISADEFYTANVSIGNDMSYSYHPINILQGSSNNIKIVTQWPAVTTPLVASVYKSSFQKVSKSDGNFVVQLYNKNENKIAESQVNVRGEAYFTNLKVGSYVLRAIDLNNNTNEAWGVTTFIDNGNQTSVQIFKNQTNNQVLTTSQVVSGTNDSSTVTVPVNSSQNLQTTISPDLLLDIKKWNGNSTTTVSDSKLLSDMGIKANHIPFWVTKIAKWVADGEINEQDFVNAIMYLHTSGIII
jgi:hypothetical protein